MGGYGKTSAARQTVSAFFPMSDGNNNNKHSSLIMFQLFDSGALQVLHCSKPLLLFSCFLLNVSLFFFFFVHKVDCSKSEIRVFSALTDHLYVRLLLFTS